MQTLGHLIALGLALIAVSNAAVPYATRAAPCTLKNLWLDVAVAIDYSNNMGTNGILQAVADVASVFSPTTVSQNLGSFTRVAVTNYTYTGETIFAMNHFRSTSQLKSEMWNIVPQSTVDPDGFIADGLVGASSALRSGRKDGTRNNVPQVILLYTSEYYAAYESDAVLQANRIKATGVSIIIIDNSLQQNISGLANIASPGMVFLATDPQLVTKVQNGLCAVNTNCPSNWTQVMDSFYNGTTRYGECVSYGQKQMTNRGAAASSCTQMGGYLASEFDQMKHFFLYDYAQNGGFSNFWIGLQANVSSQQYQWDQPTGVQPVMLGNYTAWRSGEPAGGMSSYPYVKNSPGTRSNGWYTTGTENINFVCQRNTCDTDNYCS